MSKIKDIGKQVASGLIKTALLLVVLPMALFLMQLFFLDTHFLTPGDPVPDQFNLLFLTAQGEPKIVRWTDLGHFRGTYPGFTFKLPGQGSYSPEGLHGPLIKWSVQPQDAGEDLVEVVWTGHNQTDYNYVFTSRYTVKGQDVAPSYFQARHIGQVFGTIYLTVLIWIGMGIGKGVMKVVKKVRERRARAEPSSPSQ